MADEYERAAEAAVLCLEEKLKTRQGRKDLTFLIRYGSDPESAKRAWEWVDDPTKPL